ncbi:MAG: MBL fold metallo-hydrolase [Bacteroidales bacterium]|nr:MBL fold metallo-hydrolase [Bacteroidales bacterium]
MKLTFLGTGTSQGVPMIGCDCPVCRSADPRDKRLRASVFVEYNGLSIVVDAGPDFRYQMLREGIRHIDAILLTHNHKDHMGGLDDIRAFNLKEAKPVNIYCEQYVLDALKREYCYAFAEPRYQGAPEWHVHTIDAGSPFKVYSNEFEEKLIWETGKGYRHEDNAGVDMDSVPYAEIIPIQGYHHKNRDLSVLGYRFGDVAYLTDMNVIDDCELEKLHGLKAVTLNCVKRLPHYSHFSLQECLDFFEKVGAEQSYITHISHLLPAFTDFDRELPDNVHPAYDGQTIEL